MVNQILFDAMYMLLALIIVGRCVFLIKEMPPWRKPFRRTLSKKDRDILLKNGIIPLIPGPGWINELTGEKIDPYEELKQIKVEDNL